MKWICMWFSKIFRKIVHVRACSCNHVWGSHDDDGHQWLRPNWAPGFSRSRRESKCCSGALDAQETLTWFPVSEIHNVTMPLDILWFDSCKHFVSSLYSTTKAWHHSVNCIRDVFVYAFSMRFRWLLLTTPSWIWITCSTFWSTIPCTRGSRGQSPPRRPNFFLPIHILVYIYICIFVLLNHVLWSHSSALDDFLFRKAPRSIWSWMGWRSEFFMRRIRLRSLGVPWTPCMFANPLAFSATRTGLWGEKMLWDWWCDGTLILDFFWDFRLWLLQLNVLLNDYIIFQFSFILTVFDLTSRFAPCLHCTGKGIKTLAGRMQEGHHLCSTQGP